MVQRGLAAPVRDEREAADLVDLALRDAIRLQSVADVPLGAFLSGGIDSSTVVALMQAQSSGRSRTFTIGFDEAGFNEAAHAKAVAAHLGTDHTELYVSAGQARDVIPRLPRLYSEPFADSSQIPTHLVSQMARRSVTVALSGDAGDELFGGYNRYFWGRRIWSKVSWLPGPARRALGYGIRRFPESAWNSVGALPGVSRVARLGEKAHKLADRLQAVDSPDDLYRSLVTEWAPGTGIVPGARRLSTRLDDANLVEGVSEPEHRMMAWDTATYLPDDILHKVDRAAMGVSLESRAPFLDHRVAELAWRIPLHMKIRDGQGKWILRQVLDRYVPRSLIERPKAGFAIPVGQWLRGPLRDWAQDLLSDSRLGKDGFIASGPVREKWRQHLAGTHDWTARLWAVLMFQSWLADWQGTR
jgi:asparagine synthase (glutamine-hydrolysing)